MNARDRIEAVDLLGRVLVVLSGIVRGAATADAADLRQAIGKLAANASVAVQAGQVGTPLANCFDLARIAGVSLDEVARVRCAVEAEAPTGIPAKAILNAAVLFSLVQESRIVAATSFTSRDEVDHVLARLDAAFDRAETIAADGGDSGAYRALLTLHGAVSRDLSARSRPLPRMVSFSFPIRHPALWLANRLYSDASRLAEVIAENSVVHPAFMPTGIRALSN